MKIAKKPLLREYSIDVVDVHGGHQRAEDGVEQTPGVPDHHVGRIGSGELPDSRDGQQRQHQRTKYVENRSVQGVEERKNDHSAGIEDVGDQHKLGRDHAGLRARDQVPERLVAGGVVLVPQLVHPAGEGIAGAGGIGNRLRDIVECAVDLAKDRAPVR